MKRFVFQLSDVDGEDYGRRGRGCGHHFHHGESMGRGYGRLGGGGERARRGFARFLLLDALRDGPKHGYEIIKYFEDRSGGQYAPSPGTVYPTLQFLQDLGWVTADQETERRVFQLTEAGRAELDARAEEIEAFWERLTGASRASGNFTEVGYVREELGHLMQTVRTSVRASLQEGDRDKVRKILAAIEDCRKRIREISAEEAN